MTARLAVLVDAILLVPIEALASIAATAAVRALPGAAARIARGSKPLACNLCMSLWTTIGVAIGYALVLPGMPIRTVFCAVPPAIGLAWMLLDRASPPWPLEPPGEGS